MEVYFIQSRAGRLKESPSCLTQDEIIAWANKHLGDFWRDDYQEGSEDVSLWLKKQGSLHIASKNVTRCRIPMLGNNYAGTELAIERSENNDLPLCKKCFNLSEEVTSNSSNKGISLDEALELLCISEYKERILNSNSHGELLHLTDYYILAKGVRDGILRGEIFAEWFGKVVKFAEGNWKRPESIFQHIFKIFKDNIETDAETSLNTGNS